MVVRRKHFPPIIDDNQEAFFSHLQGIIESRDELASMEITKTPYGYLFRIVPSTPKYTEHILQAVIILNSQFGIKLDLGKSIKSASTITFKITV